MKKQTNWLKSTLAASVVSACCFLNPAMAAAERQQQIEPLLHVRTANLDAAFDGIENFLAQALKGTQFAMFAMPGLPRMQLIGMTGLPPNFFDFTQPAEFAIWHGPSTTNAADKLEMAMMYPALDYGANLSKLKNLGMTVTTDAAGISAVASASNPDAPQFFISDLGRGRTLMTKSESAQVAAKAIMAKTSTTIQPPTLFELTLDLNRLIEINREKIDESIQKLVNVINYAGANAPVNAESLATVVRNATNVWLDTLVTVDRLELKVQALDDAVLLDAGVHPVAGSSLARFCTAVADNPKSGDRKEHIAVMPAGAAMLFECNVPEPAMTVLSNSFSAMLTEILADVQQARKEEDADEGDAGTTTADVVQTINDAVEKMLPLYGGHLAFATELSLHNGQMRQSQTTLVEVKDADAYKKGMIELSRSGGEIANFFYGIVGMPLRLQVQYFEDCETIADVAVSRLELDGEWLKTTNEPWASFAQAQKDGIIDSLEAMSQLHAGVGRYFISVAGPKRIQNMTTILNALKGQTQPQADWREDFSRFQSKALDVELARGLIRWSDFFRLGLMQALAATKAEKSTAMKLANEKILAELPSNSPIAIMLSVEPVDQPYLRKRACVPAGMIAEVAHGLAAFQQAMVVPEQKAGEND